MGDVERGGEEKLWLGVGMRFVYDDHGSYIERMKVAV
jgi:hypothetical protein